MSRILVISLTDLGRDPRVDRQITFLRSRHDVTTAGLGPPADPSVEFVNLGVARAAPREILRRFGALNRLIARRYEAVYWNHPINALGLERLRGNGADLVIANDLTALPLAMRVSGSAPVIFDAHELHMAEQSEHRWWRAIMRPYVDHLLRSYLPQTRAMMTVAPGIAQHYAARYNVDPVVVTNAPWQANLSPTPVGSPIRVLHHGNADPQRHLELMVESFDNLDEGFELTLMLNPSNPRYLARLRRLVSMRPRVRIVDPAPLSQIVSSCNAYDVGLYLLPPRNENLLYALPNKIFEFIQARLAIAVGPSPEMAALVRTHNCGVVAESFAPSAITETLRSLTPERICRFKCAADQAATLVNAEHNREIVLALVEQVLGT